MSLHVSETEWAQWEDERAERVARDRTSREWQTELQAVPGAWRGPNAERDLAKKLRGERGAQEVVTQLVGEINLLRWYVSDLEAILIEQARRKGARFGIPDLPAILPAHVGLVRRMALGEPESESVELRRAA